MAKRDQGLFSFYPYKDDISEIAADVLAEPFLQFDQPLGDILGLFVCRLVLIEIFAEGFDAHVASVRDQVGDGVIGFVHAELDVGLHPGHPLGDGTRLLSVVSEAVEIFLNFDLQLLVRGFAIGKTVLERVGFHVFQNVLDGADPHFHTCVAFTKQTNRILFDHNHASFRFEDMHSIPPKGDFYLWGNILFMWNCEQIVNKTKSAVDSGVSVRLYKRKQTEMKETLGRI